MTRPGVRLHYRFTAPGEPPQQGAALDNPLFDLLDAVQREGSIRHAATARSLSYRHLWGALKDWEAVLGQPLLQWTKGKPARLTPFAQRLLWAERQARVRLTPHIEALRAELERVRRLAEDASTPALELWASHDLALPQLQALAAAGGGPLASPAADAAPTPDDIATGPAALHLALRFAGSVDALRALAQGRCTLAGFHVPAEACTPTAPPASAGPPANPPALADDGADDPTTAALRAGYAAALKPLLRPGHHKLIAGWRRTQGLMLRPGLAPAPRSVAEVARAGLRFVQRQPGSGTRLLVEQWLKAARLPADALAPPDAGTPAVEETHVAVAAAIARGSADAGVGLEAAARAAGLDFVPLLAEDYHLVCLRDALDGDAVQHLRALLAAPAWHAALRALPGYAPLPAAGQVLALTRALPWWRLRPRRAAGPGGG